MKKYLLIFSLILWSVTLISCGDGGVDSSPASKHAPAISNLRFYPSSATINQGGGAITVTGYVDFIDEDGDLSTVTIVSYDLQGIAIDATTFTIQNIKGEISGTIYAYVVVSTTTAGGYPFGVYVTDEAGLNSNTLRGTFTVK